MKKLVLVFFLMIAHAESGLASGPDVTGGGDLIKMRFQTADNAFCQYLRRMRNPRELSLDPAAICHAVDTVKVTVLERTYLPDGTEVDALNFPSRHEIHLSLKRNDLRLEDEIAGLAIHEYISVIGMDDSKYRISGPIALRMGLSELRTERPAAALPSIEAKFKCEPPAWQSDWNPFSGAMISISFHNLEFKISDVTRGFTYSEGAANGEEKLVSAAPPQNGEEAYFRYEKSRPMADGMVLEERGNNFSGGAVNRMIYYNWKYTKFTFNTDITRLAIYSKDTAINRKNDMRHTFARTICDRIP